MREKLLTLAEYLEDYASAETKGVGYALIERELDKIPKEKARDIAQQSIQAIRASDRRRFTSALPVQVLKALAPALQPVLTPPASPLPGGTDGPAGQVVAEARAGVQ